MKLKPRAELQAEAVEEHFTDREVKSARVFCLGAGLLLVFGGVVALVKASGGAAIAGGVAATLGAALALFGALAPPKSAVRVAGSVLALFT